MRWKLLSFLLLSLLIFSSFSLVSAGNTQGACNACSCQNIDKDLSDVNARIENLTEILHQKEAELQKLYAEFNRSESFDALMRIVGLEDEIQDLRSKLEAYKREKLSLELIKRYTVRTPYGLQVLYYNLPDEAKLIKEYMAKIHPVRKDINLDWLIAYYTQAGELTFDKYIEADSKLRDGLRHSNLTISEALNLIREKKQIWNKIYTFAIERTKLETLKKLKTIGEQQTIMKKLAIQPLSYDFGGINQGNSCLSWSCYLDYSYRDPLPGVDDPTNAGSAPFAYYSSFAPAAVWVGLYKSNTPSSTKFWGQYCTYEFPHTSTDVKKYWDWAVEKAKSKGFYNFEDTGSIQVKLFYDGTAYNPKDDDYQEANIIWQFDCNHNGCWVINYRLDLLSSPDSVHYDEYYKLYVNKNWLSCCNGGDVGSSCEWANRHCGGCFAPDESKSQNFVVCTRSEYGSQCGWKWIRRFG